jgi:hypothetical protein
MKPRAEEPVHSVRDARGRPFARRILRSVRLRFSSPTRDRSVVAVALGALRRGRAVRGVVGRHRARFFRFERSSAIARGARLGRARCAAMCDAA